MEKNLKYNILLCGLVLYVLACLDMFAPKFIPIDNTQFKAIQSVLFAFLVLLSGTEQIKRNIYLNGFFVIFLGICISIFMASSMHEEQTIVESVRATLPRLFAYSTFFLLCKIRPSINFIEKLIFAIGFASAIQVIQIWYLFPNPIFGSFSVDPVRGIRMTALGDTFKVCLLFYCLNMMLSKFNKKHLFLFIICIISVILGIVRQVIFILTCLIFLFTFSNMSLLKKILFCCAFFCALHFATESEIYQASKTYTENEIEKNNGGENIRITAARYYINDAQVNILTRIFGNGCFAETSAYGAKALSMQEKNLCYPTDVGWAYFYHIYGILGVLGLFIIFWTTWKIQVPFRFMYLKYSVYYMMLASIASGPNLYYSQCILLPFICYLLGEVYQNKAYSEPLIEEKYE